MNTYEKCQTSRAFFSWLFCPWSWPNSTPLNPLAKIPKLNVPFQPVAQWKMTLTLVRPERIVMRLYFASLMTKMEDVTTTELHAKCPPETIHCPGVSYNGCPTPGGCASKDSSCEPPNKTKIPSIDVAILSMLSILPILQFFNSSTFSNSSTL